MPHGFFCISIVFDYLYELRFSNNLLNYIKSKYPLTFNKYFKDCRECHIEPDWLLVYKYLDDKLILVLVDTGSHSEVFK